MKEYAGKNINIRAVRNELSSAATIGEKILLVKPLLTCYPEKGLKIT